MCVFYKSTQKQTALDKHISMTKPNVHKLHHLAAFRAKLLEYIRCRAAHILVRSSELIYIFMKYVPLSGTAQNI